MPFSFSLGRSSFVGLVLLAVLFLIGPLLRPASAQETDLPAIMDTFVQIHSPEDNYEGQGLILSQTTFPMEGTTSEALVKFDLSATSGVGDGTVANFNILDNLSGSSYFTVTLYAVDDDNWDSGTVNGGTLPAKGAKLQSIRLNGNHTGLVSFGDPKASHKVGDYVKGESEGDGLVSFALVIEDSQDAGLFGAVSIEDSEGTLDGRNGNEPGLTVRRSTFDIYLPMIIRAGSALSNVVFSAESSDLAKTGSQPQAVAPEYGFTINDTDLENEVPQVGTAAYCPPPVAPDVSITQDGPDLVLNWAHHPANDQAYNIWQSTEDPFFSPTGSPYQKIRTGSGEYRDRDILAGVKQGNSFYYIVEAQSGCHGSPAPSVTVGATSYLLDGGGFSMVAQPYHNSPTKTAEDLVTKVSGAEMLVKWNPDTQGLFFYMATGQGSNFDFKIGDTVFIKYLGPETLVTLTGEVVRTEADLAPGGYAFTPLPQQLGDIGTASEAATVIKNVDSILKWDNQQQDFIYFQPKSALDIDGLHTASSSLADFTIRLGEPFGVRLLPSGPERWPADQGMMVWSQHFGASSREVLVQWYPGEVDNWPKLEFEVWREVRGSGEWKVLGSTNFPPDATTMMEIMARERKEMPKILSFDLRQPGEITVLTEQEIFDRLANNPDLAISYARQYYEVALAVGLGYVDLEAEAGVDYAYYAAPPKSLDPPYQPVCVPGRRSEPWRDFNLREAMIANVPAGLGQRPSSRPYDALERYQWDTYQDVRRMDGRAFLIWNTPPATKPPIDPRSCLDAPQLEIAGYHVYRNGRSLPDWTLVNGQTIGAARTASDVHLLLDASPDVDPSNPDNEPFYLQDNVADIYSHLEDRAIYDTWLYRICAVDRLQQELGCSSDTVPLELPIRELDSPGSILSTEVVVETNHQVLTLTWTYNDPDENSTPLRFFVTRSPTMTLPAEQWTNLTPVGIPAPKTSPTFTMSITDTPPIGQTFWYRVQARDDAGNWSPISAPAAGGLFDRKPPRPPTAEGDISCDNPMPVTIGNLGEDVRQVTVYRAFDKNGPYRLIKRLQVSGPTVLFNDLYVPPSVTTLFYQFEALDGHGNVSQPSFYCAMVGEPVAPGPLEIQLVEEGDNLLINWETGESSDVITVTVDLAGGSQTFTSTNSSGTFQIYNIKNQVIFIQGRAGNASGQSVENSLWWWDSNDFMNTGRSMTDLGKLEFVKWTKIDGKPAAQLSIGRDFNPPWVALYRRVLGGSWMQVTPISEIGRDSPMIISDTTDLDPTQVYSYTAVAFSPTSHEVIGYWEPIQLDADQGRNEYIQLNDPINHVLEPPVTCNSKRVRLPSEFPTKLALPNGWSIELKDALVSSSTDPKCPPSSPDLANLFGSGDLSNGVETWPSINMFNVRFEATTPGNATLKSGRISYSNLGYVSTTTPGWFDYVIWGVLFDGDQDNAFGEVMFQLPDGIKMFDPDRQQWNNRLFAKYPDLMPDMSYGRITYVPGDTILFQHESLPWQLQMDSLTIDPKGIQPGGTVTTVDRFAYDIRQDGFLPDNNLGYLRRTFTSNDALIKPGGLHGTFVTKASIQYQSGLPAGITVQAGDTTLSVSGSRIKGGTMEAQSLWLFYDSIGSSKDTFAPPSSQPSILELVPCYWHLADLLSDGCLSARPDRQWRRLAMAPEGNSPLRIGPDGIVTGAVDDTGEGVIYWPQFFVHTGDLPDGSINLYLAKATFPEEDQSGRQEPDSPIMVEVAWRQLADPTGSGGDLDPGINMNTLEAAFGYDYYDPPQFNAELDLYLRRGGASEHIRTVDPGDTLRTNDYGYQETVQALEVLFLDNMFDDDDMTLESDFYLPYPSDVTVPLVATIFDDHGLPTGGNTRELANLHHKYWDFRQTIPFSAAWRLVSIGETDFEVQALANGVSTADLPNRIFSLEEGQANINGLKVSGTQIDAQVPAKSQWFPDGDYGQIEVQQLTTNNDENYDFYQVSGVPFAFSGVKLSHYYSRFMDSTSLPDTLGINMEATGLDLPEELTDSNGNLTPQSLKTCSSGNITGCGFVLLDGNGTSDFFGEVETVEPPADRRMMASDGFLGDEPKGQWPVANNNRTNRITLANIRTVALRWSWAVVDDYIDELCPFVYLPDQNGGVFACVREGLEIIGEPSNVFNADLGLVADFNSNGSANVGIFAGYSASQAAFRALAMNRPNEDGLPGYINYTNWSSVKDDIINWSEKFYPEVAVNDSRDDKSDPVDLAHDTWERWDTKEFGDAYRVLSSTLISLNGTEAYGVTGLTSGSLLTSYADTTISTGMGQAEFIANGLDLTLERLYFGSQVDIGAVNDKLLHADWLSLEYSRDGIYAIQGKGVTSEVTGDNDVTADFDLIIYTADNNERVEGGIIIHNIKMSDLEFRDLGVAFGAGYYEGNGLYYFGAMGEAAWDGYSLGGAILAGTVYPDSVVLRSVGFAHALDKLQSESTGSEAKTFVGIYLAVNGDFPIYNEGCLIDVTAGGEIRFWYFQPKGVSDPIYGGQLHGSVYGEFACLLSARGDLSLTLEQVNPGNQSSPPQGWANMTRQCPAGGDGCTSFAGIFWVAMGVGVDCDPSTWDSWDTRWWGDSWCYTVGAAFGLNYINPTADSSKWDYDYDFDYE